jgi:hypothetical protein
MLSPFHFGQSVSDMGPLRIQLTRPLKGGGRVGKLSRCQARVPMRKRLER